MERPFRIGRREIGPGRPAYVIAEMSGNHNQDYSRAVEILRAAKEAGADAVKLQTYTADTLTIRSDKAHFRIRGTLWNDRTLHDLYREASTPWEWQPRLKKEASRLGMDLFSSPFDATAVDFLEKMGVPAYKIASFEIVDHALIEKAARTGKPIIMSTGMATLEEIREAVGAARRAGARDLALLKCTSAYPAPAGDMNLRTIGDLARRLRVPVGLSDHTLGIEVPVAAVALGACIIEKHFTTSRALGGPDCAFSLEPAEFAAMVSAVRKIEQSLGRATYGPTPAEKKSLVFRRSLFVVKDVNKGERFSGENVRSIRPGYGLAPKHLRKILGRKAARSISRGTPLAWSHVDGAGR